MIRYESKIRMLEHDDDDNDNDNNNRRKQAATHHIINPAFSNNQKIKQDFTFIVF